MLAKALLRDVVRTRCSWNPLFGEPVPWWQSTPFARRVLNDVFPILSIISVYAQGLEAFRESMIDGIPCSLSIGTT